MARRNARDVVVRFLSDVNGFLRGSDDVSDAYRDMAREAERTEAVGEASARDLARAYERAADKIERDARASARDTRKAYGDTGKEAGQEFSSNLGEAITSGDLSSVAADTAGGLAATFGAKGPIGAAFAAVAVAGSVAFAKIQEAAEQAKQAASEVFEALISQADKEARLRIALERQYGSYLEGMEAIRRMADATGIPVSEIAEAFAEGGEPARRLADDAERIAAALPKGGAGGAIINQADVTRAKNLAEDLDRAADATERAARAEQTRAEALRTAAYYANNPISGLPTYATGKR